MQTVSVEPVSIYFFTLKFQETEIVVSEELLAVTGESSLTSTSNILPIFTVKLKYSNE